jgi:hypothetical protein
MNNGICNLRHKKSDDDKWNNASESNEKFSDIYVKDSNNRLMPLTIGGGVATVIIRQKYKFFPSKSAMINSAKYNDPWWKGDQREKKLNPNTQNFKKVATEELDTDAPTIANQIDTEVVIKEISAAKNRMVTNKILFELSTSSKQSGFKNFFQQKSS